LVVGSPTVQCPRPGREQWCRETRRFAAGPGVRALPKSLCHAWGAGPAAILPAEILGLRPTKDGWAEFTVEPRLGSLSWVTAAVPTPSGRIEIDVRDGQLTLSVPAGSRLRWRGQTHVGPTTIRRAVPRPAP